MARSRRRDGGAGEGTPARHGLAEPVHLIEGEVPIVANDGPLPA